MNSGVLLMRNTDWMRDLFNQMARYGTHPMDYAMEEVRARPRCTTLHGCPDQSCAAMRATPNPHRATCMPVVFDDTLVLVPLLVTGVGDAGALTPV